MTTDKKVFAVSKNRSNGGIRTKRAWGSSTITTFIVGYEGSESATWKDIDGYGKTPGDRKTYAMNKFREMTAV